VRQTSSRRRQTITAAEQQHTLESNAFTAESNGSAITANLNQSQDESLESLTSRSQNGVQTELQHHYSLRSRHVASYYRPQSAHSLLGSSLLGCGVAVIPSSYEDIEEWSDSGNASQEKATASIDDDESVASLYIDHRIGGSEDDDELDGFDSVCTDSKSQTTSLYTTMVGTQSVRSVSLSPRTVISDDAGSGSFATALLAPPVRTVSLSSAPPIPSASFSTTQIVTTSTTTTTTIRTTTTRNSFLAGHTAASSMPMVLVSDDDQSFQSLCDDYSIGSDRYYSVGQCELEQANSFDSDMMYSAVSTSPVSQERQSQLGTTVPLDEKQLEDSDADSRTDSNTVEGNEHATMHSVPGAIPPASSPSDHHLASTSSVRPIDHSIPPARTDEQIDSFSNFCAGDRVYIQGGKYKGKTGTVSRLTQQRVAVKIDGMDPNAKPPCLAPHNVALQDKGHENGTSLRPSPLIRCSQQRPHSPATGEPLRRVDALDQIPNLAPVLDDEISLDGGSLCDMNDGINDDATMYSACQDLAAPQNQALPMSDLALDTSKHSNEDATKTEVQHNGKWKAGDSVDIIGGKYKGESGTFVKFTAAKVQVELLVDDKPTVRCLARKSVIRRVGSVLGTREGVENNASAEESNQTPTSSQPRTTRSQTRVAAARTCTVVEPRVTRSSTRVPVNPRDETIIHSGNFPHESQVAPRTFLGFRVGSFSLLSPNRLAPIERTLAFGAFGHRLVMAEIEMSNQVQALPSRHTESDGSTYELLSTKLHRKKGTSMFNPTVITAHYVLVQGSGESPINLKDELERLAGFAWLPPRKVAARLELLLTPASVRNNNPLVVNNLSTYIEVEDITEIAHEGCGFMPVGFAARLLGKGAIGKRTFALQVRIVSSKHGIFKGMLVEKPGISKIQLPESMRKVGPSEHSDTENVQLLIKGVFPSKSNALHLPKVFNPEKEAPKSFCPRKLSDMICNVLKIRGVPAGVIDAYRDQSHGNRGSGLEHTFLIGVSDPTESIPPGFVFVTGVHESPIKNTVLVSRFPCTEVHDAHVLPVLRDRPSGMSEENWEWLCAKPFGAMIFGNPARGDRPLPSRIADGDLDGDLYFACWHDPIVSLLEPSIFDGRDITEDFMQGEEEKDRRRWNENWLEDGQELMGDVQALANTSALIGKLYKEWNNALNDGQGRAVDTVAFGRAYKAALDIGKHGGHVYLPKHLHAAVPEHIRSLLTDEETI
jgi:ribosomal protein L24